MRKIVLMACEGSHITPEMNLGERFIRFITAGIGKGDEVWIHPKGGQPLRLSEGPSPIPPGFGSFTVEKKAGSAPAPTFVEVTS